MTLSMRRKNKQRLIVDVDSTKDPAHGKQEKVAFNGHFVKELLSPALRVHQRRGLPAGEAQARQRSFSRWASGLPRSDCEAVSCSLCAFLASG